MDHEASFSKFEVSKMIFKVMFWAKRKLIFFIKRNENDLKRKMSRLVQYSNLSIVQVSFLPNHLQIIYLQFLHEIYCITTSELGQAAT